MCYLIDIIAEPPIFFLYLNVFTVLVKCFPAQVTIRFALYLRGRKLPTFNNFNNSTTFSSLQLTWSFIKLYHATIFIGVICIPPGRSNCESFMNTVQDSVSQILVRMKLSHVLMLMGDFYTPSLSWSQSPDGDNGLLEQLLESSSSERSRKNPSIF